ncbi:MAG: LysM peptidoglycan-binding domain-containing protein [Gemmobacter sp.]|nr:LysM peptidoglycan-binding domain-containing protein [Gemmobacter sp.]
MPEATETPTPAGTAASEGTAPVGSEATEAAAAPVEPAPAEPPVANPEPPRFDTVRVTPEGEALVAGRAEPGAEVSVRVDGQEITTTATDGTGAFVAMFGLPASDQPRLLTLMTRKAGVELASEQSVALEPTEPVTVAAADPSVAEPESEPGAPAAILLDEDGAATVLQGAPPVEGAEISIAAITYTPEGAVLLAGQAVPGATVRLYLDNAEVAESLADGSGAWTATLHDVAPGLYTLRADQIGADGKVTARFETPFQRETPEVLAAVVEPEPPSTAEPVAEAAAKPTAEAEVEPAVAAEPAAPASDAPVSDLPVAEVTGPPPVTVTVQPGFTLWRIARENFGDGFLYVKVFEANRDQIRNPDLIYPGQVFTIPQR